MKKLTISFLTCILLFATILPFSVSADMGPKPSVVLDFIGISEGSYYATLLADTDTTGPHSMYVDGEYSDNGDNHDVYLKFKDFKDVDGYRFLQYYENCTDTNKFSWTYYPPEKFKILLYFTDTDKLVVSDEVYERYAFDSYYTVNVSEGNISAARSYDYSGEIIALIFRIILTVLVEIIVALVFGFRTKKQMAIIFIVNLITQIALNIILTLIIIHTGKMLFILIYLLLEVIVIVVETVLYLWLFLNWGPGTAAIRKRKLIIYTIVANALSFILGLILSNVLPSIF